MSIRYTITPSNPVAHIYSVTCTVNQPDPSGQILSMPTWIPGSYMIRDFARNIISIKALCNNQSVDLHKLDKTTWQSAPVNGPLEVHYTVYAWDLSVRTAHLDQTHAYFNGSSVFLAVQGLTDVEHKVTLHSPEGKDFTNWTVLTTLTKQSVDNRGFGTYVTRDYEELIDHPVEIGQPTYFEFKVADIPHKVALTGQHRCDAQRLQTDLQKICQTHINLYGELPAINQYLFQVMVTGNGYGGLEHRSSTSLVCSRKDLPLAGHPEEPEDDYRNFLGLCSHEYFHTWNVKQIKPEVFLPYNLRHETHTTLLWAFEGFTAYYDELALVRSGVISEESYLDLLGQTITRVQRGTGRLLQSLAESSFDAWTKFYKQDESAPNTIVSYYTKGALFALCLDLKIRSQTSHRHSLDDVMRRLWQEHGKPCIGVPEGKIEHIASEVAGTDLHDFFADYVYATKELPLAELLATMGIVFNMRSAITLDDKGGKPARKDQEICSLDARVSADKVGAKLIQVLTGGNAERAGLSAGDVIIAVNNLQVEKANLESEIASYPVGSRITLHAFRRDELMQFDVTLQAAEKTTCYLTLDSQAAESTFKHRQRWLGLINE